MAHILLIDDEDGLRRVLCHALEKAGHSVRAVCDGREAIRHFDDSFQLVIIDMLMPHMGGLETIDALKKRAPSIPVIGMSGGGEISPDDYLAVAKVIGADRTLAKPFNEVCLLRAVNDLLAEPVSSR